MAAVSSAEGADRTIRGTGTSERDWSTWAGWQQGIECTLPELVPAGRRLVVIAPHPDDETLAAGGLMCDAAAAGRAVLVIAVTPGNASHPGSTRWPVAELTEQRRAERAGALRCLGAANADVCELDIADGAVTEQRAAVCGALVELLRPDDIVVAPWRYDGHPDHEASCAAAVDAAGRCGARLLQAPIWGWHWAGPEQGVLPEGALLYPLSEQAQQAKHAAVAQFSSQLQPDSSTGAAAILPSWALSRWLRTSEVFFGD